MYSTHWDFRWLAKGGRSQHSQARLSSVNHLIEDERAEPPCPLSIEVMVTVDFGVSIIIMGFKFLWRSAFNHHRQRNRIEHKNAWRAVRKPGRSASLICRYNFQVTGCVGFWITPCIGWATQGALKSHLNTTLPLISHEPWSCPNETRWDSPSWTLVELCL